MKTHSGDKNKNSVTSVFHEVQFSSSKHSSLKTILTEIYKKTRTDKFLKEFVKCLKICLLHGEKSPNVEKTLDFAAEFAVSFCSDLKEYDNCPLLEGVFQFIFENHDCQIQLVRLRICQLMNRLLDDMGQDASVLEETYNKIAESMLVRLKDSMSSVRTQAVYALHRLQSPSDPECDIITAFKFHMIHDPCHEVRRAVIQKIAVTKTTLALVLTRVNDVKDSVRKEAYIFINRLLIRQFTIKQRQLILENGMGDRSDVVKDYVIGTLVPNWLKYCNYSYYEFLECIHVEKIPVIGIKLLKIMFEKQHDVILESRTKDMFIADHKIAYNKLNKVTAVYWRALVEYVKPTDNNDKFEHIFEQIIPDLTPFCQYIRGYLYPAKSKDPTVSESFVSPVSINTKTDSEKLIESQSTEATLNKNTENNKELSDSSPAAPEIKKETDTVHKPDEAVLVHLLEMCKVFDLSDELGRENLRQMCVDLLQSTTVTQQSTTAVLASLLDYAVPTEETRLSVMAEIITELREPLHSPDATTASVPDLLLMEAEEKKAELNDKIKDLEAEMEIAQELGDEARIQEIKELTTNLKKELKIMNEVTPHEPGRNVNNDPETLKKCLTIVVEIMKKGNIRKMNATLYSLMQNFIIPTLKRRIEVESAPIINMAMQVLGIFCLLDEELAKEHFMMFCFNIATESLSVTALKCLLDLLHFYGLSMFNIEDPDSAASADGEEQHQKPNLVNLLMSLINSESVEMRRTATLGLCKLLFAGRIKSANLLSKLILLWNNPAVETDPYIRQPLGAFFSMFAGSCPHAPPLLVQAFLPTLKQMFQLEVTDPMAEVDVETVADLMVDFTRPGYNIHVSKDKSLHNEIAIQICELILSEELQGLQCAVLLKTLNHLELNFDLTTEISILNALVARMIKSIPKDDKTMYRLLLKMESTLQMRIEQNRTISTVNNTLPHDTSERPSTAGRSQLMSIKDSESDGEEEEEEEVDEEEEFSQDMTTLHTIDSSEAMVIPGTPETSDSDCDEHSCPSEIKYPKVIEEEEVDFRGFNPQFKGFSPGFKGFKEPSAPPLKTPAKTPFKVPGRTPRKAVQTPAKSKDLETSKEIKTPAANTPTHARTTSEQKKASLTTPETIRTLVSASERLNITPKSDSLQDAGTSGRVTRSGRKRKS